jgi:hypothetical protein
MVKFVKEVKMEVHKGALDTYLTISSWASPQLPYSTTLKWDRMGLLAMLVDYVLYYSPGNILEIGVGESSIYLSTLAQKYSRHICHCDLQQSVIINAATVPGYFMTPFTVVVEGEKRPFEELSPHKCILFIGHSDNFFEEVPPAQLAVAFIDGDHLYEQVRKDFFNVVPRMHPEGYIFLHDTYPPDASWTGETSCGTVYQLRREIESMRDQFECFTFPRSALNVGLTMVRLLDPNRPDCRR